MTTTQEVDWSHLTLKHGKHDPPSDPGDPTKVEACIMEAVYLRWALQQGWSAKRTIKEWTDQPSCSCPVITSVLIGFNDRCGSDERRTRVLGPLMELAIGTRSTKEVERRRIWLSVDWSLRVATPKLLRAAGMVDQAERLESLAPIESDKALADARAVIFSARDAACARREDAWKRIRASYAAEVEEAAVAAAAAAVEEAAVAVAVVAVAEVAAEVEEAAAAAVVAVAEVAEVAADSDIRRIFDAAHAARKEGGDYYACRAAARKVADEVFAGRKGRFAQLRDELDAEFVDIVKRMIAIKEAA